MLGIEENSTILFVVDDLINDVGQVKPNFGICPACSLHDSDAFDGRFFIQGKAV